jgi:hypothetical protein
LKRALANAAEAQRRLQEALMKLRKSEGVVQRVQKALKKASGNMECDTACDCSDVGVQTDDIPVQSSHAKKSVLHGGGGGGGGRKNAKSIDSMNSDYDGAGSGSDSDCSNFDVDFQLPGVADNLGQEERRALRKQSTVQRLSIATAARPGTPDKNSSHGAPQGGKKKQRRGSLVLENEVQQQLRKQSVMDEVMPPARQEYFKGSLTEM